MPHRLVGAKIDVRVTSNPLECFASNQRVVGHAVSPVSVSLQAVTLGRSFCHQQFRGTFDSRAFHREHPLTTSLRRCWPVTRARPSNWHNLAFDPFNLSQPADQRVVREILAREPAWQGRRGL